MYSDIREFVYSTIREKLCSRSKGEGEPIRGREGGQTHVKSRPLLLPPPLPFKLVKGLEKKMALARRALEDHPQRKKKKGLISQYLLFLGGEGSFPPPSFFSFFSSVVVVIDSLLVLFPLSQVNLSFRLFETSFLPPTLSFLFFQRWKRGREKEKELNRS